MVREFYASAKDHQDLKVYVRGKWICFDRTSINRFYRLADIDKDDFLKCMKRGNQSDRHNSRVNLTGH